MAQFVFMYRHDEVEKPSPAQMEQRMQRWIAWFDQMTKEGRIRDRGVPLERSGKVTRSGKSVTDGPYAEKDLVIGFTVVEADDLAHAVALSQAHPLLLDGGQIEVRPVYRMLQS